MIKPFLTLIALITLLAGCGRAEEESNELDAIPRDLITCLKGGSCAGYKVKITLPGTKHFSKSFDKIWANYPSIVDSSKVKSDIGGNVDADYITNTCVIRTSRALNYSGAAALAIPGDVKGLTTVRGADNKRYAFRVVEMAIYMLANYGRPQIRDLKDIKGRKGIILYDREGWDDANGHFDIWNGSGVRLHDYSKESTNVFLWE